MKRYIEGGLGSFQSTGASVICGVWAAPPSGHVAASANLEALQTLSLEVTMEVPLVGMID